MTTNKSKSSDDGESFPSTPLTVMQKHSEYVREHLLKAMYSRLQGKVHDPKEFCQWLKYNQAVMAGSFPLQVLLGATWEDSDIDIFVLGQKDAKLGRGPDLSWGEIHSMFFGDLRTYNTSILEAKVVLNSDIGKKLFRTIGHDGKTIITNHDAMYFSPFGCCLKYLTKKGKYCGVGSVGSYENKDIVRISQYHYFTDKEIKIKCKECVGGFKMYNCDCAKVKRTGIEIVHLDDDKYLSVKDFVKGFDLDFCKVMFDGEKFEILDMDSIVTRKSKYRKNNDYEDRVSARKKKYTQRGFTIK